jgi:ATP-binding cassette subfamily B protein
MAGVAPSFIVGAAGGATPGRLAVAVGGVVLAHRALRKLTTGWAQLAGAAIAWRQVEPLYRAAARLERPGAPVFSWSTNQLSPAPSSDETGTGGRSLVQAQEVVFRYRELGEPVLRGVTLRIASGDRLLIEGPSGGGKSTLGAVLAGLRAPESGLLLLGGLDRRTLGPTEWRRRVVAAPQFHENHVLSGPLAFNLLMGRDWPPSRADLEEADAICRELDLGSLLDRMPSGLMQIVGETGWQLSHGERSRLFIARALLQRAELVVLDESFAALDPETLAQAMRCVLARAPTVMVIAHP